MLPKKEKVYMVGVWGKNAIGFYSKNGFHTSGEHVFEKGTFPKFREKPGASTICCSSGHKPKKVPRADPA